MVVLITTSQPPPESSYDQWRVYRSTSVDGSYSLVATRDLTDPTYPDGNGTSTSWYKLKFYDSNADSEGAFSSPFQGQTTHYTTVEKVRSLGQLQSISDSTSPSISEINEIIARVEDWIDSTTNHAWRVRYSGTAGALDQEPDYEYVDIDLTYEWHTGLPVYLPNRQIRDFDSSLGDVMEFWNGSSYEDWLSTKTEGRAEDWWIDNEQGVIYVRGYWNVRKPKGLRVKYRYGESFVDGRVEEVATKAVLIEILTGMDARTIIGLSGGESSMSHDNRVEVWSRRINQLLSELREWAIPSIKM